MQTHLAHLTKSYFSTYRGLSNTSYYGFVLSLLESIFIGIYYYLSIYFIDVLHLDMFTSGMIISCYGVGAVFGGIMSGKLSDQWSPGLVSASALLIQSIVCVFFVKLQTTVFLMCNVFMLGVASYGFITANHLFVLNCCSDSDSQRLRAINILSMTSNLGLGLSALIMGMALTIGFHAIFLISSISLFLLAFASYFCAWRVNLLGSALLLNQKKSSTKKLDVTPMQSNKKLGPFILLSVFFVGLIVTQLGTTYSIYIKESFPELGMKAITFLFALNSFIVVFLSAPLGVFIEQYNKITMVGVGAFLIGYGMLMLSFSGSLIMVVVACIVYTLGEIIFFSVAQLVCYKNGLQNKKGRSLGLYRMVYASSRVIGPAVGGFIYPKFGADMIWVASGIIGLLCLISCGYYKKFD